MVSVTRGWTGWRGVGVAVLMVLVGLLGVGVPGASGAVTGTDWTMRTSATDNDWYSVTYGNGLFVAVALSGAVNRVMTSPDGITWTSRTSAADNSWDSVTYGDGTFVAVAAAGGLNKVIHLWAYESLDERARRRATLWSDPEWLDYVKEVGGLVQHQENQILSPAPFFQVPPAV